jgi:phospholipid/cholesterol/gamma-HCH transport system ATP-binding protein
LSSQSTQPADDQAFVELRDISFGYSDRQIHKNLSLSVPKGSIVAVMGPSGCGKSTLLNFVGGRLKPQSGEVLFDGRSVMKAGRKELFGMRHKMGMMFQHNALLTDLTVFENVAFPIREHYDFPESMVRDLVLMKLEMVGLRGARDLMPEECSGGMQRRVALARAVALDPQLVMYDEPFTGLDPISKGVIKTLIKELNDSLGMTSLVVTHDMQEGCEIADYVAVLGKGSVMGFGSPEDMQASSLEEIRQFMAGDPHGPVPYHYPADDYFDDMGIQQARGKD